MAQFRMVRVFTWTFLLVSSWISAFSSSSEAFEASETPASAGFEDFIQKRLLVAFNPSCSHTEVSKRALLTALETRRIEQDGPENFEVLSVDGGDFPAYTRTIFSKMPLSGISKDEVDACTVFHKDLKHVGVTVMTLTACPELDVPMLKHFYEEDACVQRVSEDSIMNIVDESAEDAKEFSAFASPEAVAPSDVSSEAFSYWIDIIQAPQAWKFTTCSASIVVGIIDTGVDVTHPNLRDNLWVNRKEIPGNGIDDDMNGFVDDVNGYDFFSYKGEMTDPQGHGTHCAGIVGATSPGAAVGDGISGVCQHVSIAGLRFMSPSGSGATSSAIEALNYAAQMKFPITSNSWGSSSSADMLEIAIKNVGALGQLFIAAAGNDGRNTDYGKHYPSSYSLPNIVSVAATDSRDNLASFSNYGVKTVHIAAPGVQLLSTYPNNQVRLMSGTSMATPVVSGVVAMILSKGKMNPLDVRSLLMRTADVKSNLNGRVAARGRVNAFKALEELEKL